MGSENNMAAVPERSDAELLRLIANDHERLAPNAHHTAETLRQIAARLAQLDAQQGASSPASGEGVERVTPALHEGGRFRQWSTVALAAQCLSQAREQLDPEFSQFMTAVAERLSTPLAAATQPAVPQEAWDWLASKPRLAVEHFGPVYGDDDDQSTGWRVMRETGPINDREWDEVGRGDTPLAAVVEARAALTGAGENGEQGA